MVNPDLVEYKEDKEQKDKAKNNLGSIILQMPSNIQDGNAVDYGESKMNTLMGAAAGVIGAGIEGGGEIISSMLAKTNWCGSSNP